MKRKKRTTLPRVTVLAMSRRELVEFVSAVSDLRTLRLELSELVASLDKIVRRRSPRSKAAAVPELLGVPAIDETDGIGGES